MNPLTAQQLIDFAYIIAVALFILALKWLSSPASARRGILAGEIGAALAVVATLCNYEIVDYKWIIVALVVGAVVGIPLGLVHMTAVPQRTALSHAFGALAAAMIGIAEYYVRIPHVNKFEMVEICARGDHRVAHLHRQLDRRGETPGNPAAASHHLQGAELRQPVACSAPPWSWRCGWSSIPSTRDFSRSWWESR